MSEYVTIVESMSGNVPAHAIVRSTDPALTIQAMRNAWPFASVTILHSIRADNHAGMLLDLLRAKYAGLHVQGY